MFFSVLCLTFFLTGCATGGYHSPVGPVSEGAGPFVFQGPVGEGSFTWPVSGRVTKPFGALEEVTLKGIWIELAQSAWVRAAADGQVVVAEEKLRGYGKTVIIQHRMEFSTVYAWNAQLCVKQGQWVRRGEPVARAGKEQNGRPPRIYFELRKQGKAVDPERYLVSHVKV